MEIITTHINADFDGLASMIAARHVYPDAELVFPGSQEKCVQQYLSEQISNIYPFKKLKHVPLKEVTRLILVDTRQFDRIGPLTECLANEGIEIHIYDHHPDSLNDIHGHPQIIKPLGSTTTIFCQIYQQKKIIPSQEEATLMALGIYQDTGNFLHSTTRPADMRAAAWLLEYGANLDTINQFVSRELSALQVTLLGKLLNNAVSYPIGSVNITLTRLVVTEYIPDFSIIVQRMMSMENINVLFAIINMDERVYLIARSRIPEVNVGVIARALGGGGHASAASATIKNKTLFETEEKLISLLHNHIRPRAIAGEIMSSPVISVTPDVPIEEANDLMTRYNVTVLPVVGKKGTSETDGKPAFLLGMISRMVVEKAIFHKLGKLPVEDYMTTEVATVSQTGTLADIQTLIIDNRQRLIPVMNNEIIVGVITRTDLLSLLINDPAHLSNDLLQDEEHRPSIKRTRNLSNTIAQNLPKDLVVLLQEVGEVAEEMKYNAFVAGGFVRDLLLHISNSDIDVVIEGDGIRFAREYARRKGAAVRTHEKFSTATVIFPDDTRVDVATARLEYYAHPAAMPTVELSSIKLDLYRRDFTINAMAIHLNPERFGTLADYFNCQNDLKERRIQVLHNLSFVEDPTRILRAIRFEGRLDFQITRHTEKLIKNAINMQLFDQFDKTRFFYELKLILSEDNPMPALRRLSYFKMFKYLWPDLRPNLKIDRRFIHSINQANRSISWFRLTYLDEKIKPWIVYLLAIMSRSRTRELLNFCRRFDLPAKLKKNLVQQKTDAERIARDMVKRPYMKPSEIYWLLIDLENEGLLYLMTIARKKHIQQAVSTFVTTLKAEETVVSGKTLLEIGYKPGPNFRTMLNHILELQLDGEIKTADEAITFIKATYPLMDERPL